MLPVDNSYAQKYIKAHENLKVVYSRAEENARYYAGDNWTKRDRDLHDSQGMQSYAVPLVAVKLNKILSEQRSNRYDWKFLGRGEEDEIGAEIMSFATKYVSDYNKYIWEESEVYQNGLTEVYGVLKVWVDYLTNPRGEIVMESIQPNQFYWDTNSTKFSLHKDATFMGESVVLPLDSVREMYNKDISDAGQGLNFAGLKKTDWFDSKKKLVSINEHYERKMSLKYLVKNIRADKLDYFDSKADANAFIKSSLENSMQALAEGTAPSVTLQENHFKVLPKRVARWDKVCFIGNSIIEEPYEYEFSRPPYTRYCSMINSKGLMWSVVDLAKDSQVAYDRYTAMADKSTAKNIKGNNYYCFPDRLHEREQANLDGLMTDLSGGGRTVFITKEGAIGQIDSHNNIQIELTLRQEYKANLEDILGGRTSQGLDSNAKTATEVALVNANSRQTGMLYMDNLSRFRNDVGEQMLEIIPAVYTKDRVVTIMGEIESDTIKQALVKSGLYDDSKLRKGEYGFINLNKLPMPLRDYNVNLIIEDVDATASEKEKKYKEVLLYSKLEIESGRAPLSAEIMTYYSPLDPSVKMMIIEDRKVKEEQARKMQEEQADLEKVKAMGSLVKDLKPEAHPEEMGLGEGMMEHTKEQHQPDGIPNITN